MAPDHDAYSANAPYPVDPAEIRSALTEPPDRRGDPQEDAKSGPPTLLEWQNFISRTVLRAITEAWLYLCLGDLVMQLDPNELALIALTKEQYNEMSAPLASLANKSKIARRHGRFVISTADSFNALFELALWMNRVRRIARKHRPASATKTARTQHSHGTTTGDTINGSNGFGAPAPANGNGPFGAGVGIYNPGSG